MGMRKIENWEKLFDDFQRQSSDASATVLTKLSSLAFFLLSSRLDFDIYFKDTTSNSVFSKAKRIAKVGLP